MSERPPIMTVEASTIATDEKLDKLELTIRPLVFACSVAFERRFQWLYGGKVTSTVLFDRSLLQLEPSLIPVEFS